MKSVVLILMFVLLGCQQELADEKSLRLEDYESQNTKKSVNSGTLDGKKKESSQNTNDTKSDKNQKSDILINPDGTVEVIQENNQNPNNNSQTSELATENNLEIVETNSSSSDMGKPESTEVPEKEEGPDNLASNPGMTNTGGPSSPKIDKPLPKKLLLEKFFNLTVPPELGKYISDKMTFIGMDIYRQYTTSTTYYFSINPKFRVNIFTMSESLQKFFTSNKKRLNFKMPTQTDPTNVVVEPGVIVVSQGESIDFTDLKFTSDVDMIWFFPDALNVTLPRDFNRTTVWAPKADVQYLDQENSLALTIASSTNQTKAPIKPEYQGFFPNKLKEFRCVGKEGERFRKGEEVAIPLYFTKLSGTVNAAQSTLIDKFGIEFANKCDKATEVKFVCGETVYKDLTEAQISFSASCLISKYIYKKKESISCHSGRKRAYKTFLHGNLLKDFEDDPEFPYESCERPITNASVSLQNGRNQYDIPSDAKAQVMARDGGSYDIKGPIYHLNTHKSVDSADSSDAEELHMTIDGGKIPFFRIYLRSNVSELKAVQTITSRNPLDIKDSEVSCYLGTINAASLEFNGFGSEACTKLQKACVGNRQLNASTFSCN